MFTYMCALNNIHATPFPTKTKPHQIQSAFILLYVFCKQQLQTSITVHPTSNDIFSY